MRYDYKCEGGHIVEIAKSMADPHPTDCPICGKPLRRLFNAVAIHGFSPYLSDRAMRGRDTGDDDGLDAYDKQFGILQGE